MMDIATLSISLHEAQLMQQVSFAVTEMAMDTKQQHVIQVAKNMQMNNTQQLILGDIIDKSI